MRMLDQIERAGREAVRAGVRPAAIVMGDGQWGQACEEAQQHLVHPAPGAPTRINGLVVLVSEKCAGPLVVDDDLRHTLQATGRFRVIP